jgi:hypothetical protein
MLHAPVTQLERENAPDPIKDIMYAAFGSIEGLQNHTIEYYTSADSSFQNHTGLFDPSNDTLDKFMLEIQRVWGMPPYNEGLVHPDIYWEDKFDAPESMKVARSRGMGGFDDVGGLADRLWKGIDNMEMDYLKVQYLHRQEEGWRNFWSRERVELYMRQNFLENNCKIVFIKDSEKNIVGWLIVYETNPSRLMQVNVLDDIGDQVDQALYIDTSGFSWQYRDKVHSTVKGDMEKRMMFAFKELTELYKGRVLTRSHMGDSKVTRMAQRLLGFKDSGITSKVDPQRYYSIGNRLYIDESNLQYNSQLLSMGPLGNLVHAFINSPEILYIEHRLRMMVNGTRVGAEQYMIEAIDMVDKSNMTAAEVNNLDELQKSIRGGLFFIELAKRYKLNMSKVDLVMGFPVSLILSIYTYKIILDNYPQLIPVLGLLEALPGGTAALYRSLYLIVTLGIPQSLEALKDDELTSTTLRNNIVKSLSTYWDGGWLIMPLLRDKKYSVLGKALISKIVSDLENKIPNIRDSLKRRLNKEAEVNLSQ